MPHKGGPVGPVCAVEAGLIRPPEGRSAVSLFSRKPAVRARRNKAQTQPCDDGQMDLLAEAIDVA